MQVVHRFAIEPMREEDIAAVQEIERDIFPTPWPRHAYHSELTQNRNAVYIVLREGGEMVGYGGLWRVQHEAHITTIGVRRHLQGRGFGRMLFLALLQRAYELRARWITLEVRVGNERAMHLYEDCMFKVIGRRRGYYTDNGEDAVVMWSDQIHAPSFKQHFLAMLHRVEVAGMGAEPSQEYPVT